MTAKHGKCIHFNGVQNRRCRMGITYDVCWPSKKTPCVEFYERHVGNNRYEKIQSPFYSNVNPCPFREEPTEEQVQRDKDEWDCHVKKIIAAMEVASEWRVKPKPEQNRHEVIECPICKGRLHLSQSAYNGHVHGHCETDNCVSWME